MMNKIKLTFLLLASAVIILFSSCGGMTAGTDDVSIDLSAAVSRATVDGATINHVKVWLIYEGTSNFYPLPEDQAEQSLGDDNTITLTHIPVGPSYRIYLSLGEKVGDKFTISRSVNGLINVTGGTSTGKTLQVENIKTSLFNTLVSEPVRGAAFANSKVFTVAADGSKIYHGTISSMDENPAPAGFVLTDVDAAYGNNVMITANAIDGRAVGIFDGSSALADSDFDFSSGLAAEMGGGAVNLQSSFVYYDSPSEMQLGISQMYGGVVLSVYADFDGDLSFETDWLPIDFSDALAALEEFDINLDDDFFKGFSAVNTGSVLHLFISSKIGNFRIKVPYSASGLDNTGFGTDDNIFELFTDFALNNPVLVDRVVINLGNADNDNLFVGTDRGLFKMTIEENVADMIAESTYAAGERIELLQCSADYTAAVTALKLIVINNDTDESAVISFNEGLPADGLLNDGGITGLDWQGSTLYLSGDYGLAALDVSTANTLLTWE